MHKIHSCFLRFWLLCINPAHGVFHGDHCWKKQVTYKSDSFIFIKFASVAAVVGDLLCMSFHDWCTSQFVVLRLRKSRWAGLNIDPLPRTLSAMFVNSSMAILQTGNSMGIFDQFPSTFVKIPEFCHTPRSCEKVELFGRMHIHLEVVDSLLWSVSDLAVNVHFRLNFSGVSLFLFSFIQLRLIFPRIFCPLRLSAFSVGICCRTKKRYSVHLCRTNDQCNTRCHSWWPRLLHDRSTSTHLSRLMIDKLKALLTSLGALDAFVVACIWLREWRFPWWKPGEEQIWTQWDENTGTYIFHFDFDRRSCE